MIKKNRNYVTLCLIMLIVSSLIYVTKYDIEEFSGSAEHSTVRTNLGNLATTVLENRMEDVRITFDRYWESIYAQYIEGSERLNNCPNSFLSYMEKIKKTLENYNSDSNLCSAYNITDYYKMNISSTKDIERDERIKSLCRKNMLNKNADLKKLIDDYNENETTLGRCEYLNNGVF